MLSAAASRQLEPNRTMGSRPNTAQADKGLVLRSGSSINSIVSLNTTGNSSYIDWACIGTWPDYGSKLQRRQLFSVSRILFVFNLVLPVS